MIAKLALLLTFCSTTVLAQTTDVPTPPKPEKKLCRTYQETGSIMGGKKICHTKPEWTAIDQRNSDDVPNSRDLNGHAGVGRAN